MLRSNWSTSNLLVLLFSVPTLIQTANAQSVILTLSGTVQSGTDGDQNGNGNVFGGGTDLSGLPFTLAITYDASQGSSIYATCPDGSVYESENADSILASGPTAILQIGSGSFSSSILPIDETAWTVQRTAPASCEKITFASFFVSMSQSFAKGTSDWSFGGNEMLTPPTVSSGDWRSSVPPTPINSNQSLRFNISAFMNNAPFKIASGVLTAETIMVSGFLPQTTPNSGKSLGSGATCPGNCQAGNPIDVGSGNKYEEVTDYTTVGANPLGFTRYYNSLASPQTLATTMGKNWRSTFDRYINIISSNSVLVERPDGQILNFLLNNGVWTPDTDVELYLTQSGSTWTLSDRNDNVETFTAINSTTAVLSSIKARNGYLQTLNRNSSNVLTSVADSYNRTLSFTYQNGLINTVTTSDGLVLTYGYDSSGATPGTNDRLISVSYSTSPVTSQTYLYENSALPFAMTGITDEDGNRFASWTYDSQGRGLTSQHAGGADLTTITYNDNDGSRTVTNALGQTMLFKFTTLQGLPKITEIDRQATSTTAAATRTFSYDTNGYKASETDWNGNLTNYVNDSHGQPTQITEAVGTPQQRVTTIQYDPVFVHLPKQIVTPGLTSNFTYDSSGNLQTNTQLDTTTTTAPYATGGASRTWTYTWSNSLLASVQGPRTDVQALTKYTYDGTGALTATTNALGQTTNITRHLPGGLPQTIVDANGVTTTLAYDPRLRLTSIAVATAAGVLTTQYKYDAAGNLTSVIQPDGSTITNSYDQAHRLTGVADLFKQSMTYVLDALGDRSKTSVTNVSGNLQRLHTATFDALGRILQDIGGVSQTTAYMYDLNGNTTQVTDPLGNVTQQVFDALNRPVDATDAAGNITYTSYDAHDRPLSVTDPNGQTTMYVYDGFGDVIQRTSPVTGVTVYRYDADGNRTQGVDSRGAIANYAYDALDRVTATTYPQDAAENVSYNYDQSNHGFGIGRLTSVTDAVGTLSRSSDERGNILSEIRKNGNVALATAYGYDAASRIVSVTYPSGLAVSYSRDSMGRVTAIATQAKGAAKSTTAISGIMYQPFGPVSGYSLSNGVGENRTFDLDYRLNNLSDTGKNPVQGLTYVYDAANNVKTITDSVTAANSQKFGYDNLNRLTSAVGSYGQLSYTYDALGNRVSDTPRSTAGALDGMGSITGFTYNQAGRVAAVSAGSKQIAGYTYDAFGQRLAKSSASATLYQYDLAGHLLEETDGQGNATADYIYLADLPVAVVQQSSVYFVHSDRLGTPQQATDSNQVIQWTSSYDPFGTTSTSIGLIVQDLRLPGQEFDRDLGIGLYHNGFRNYSPFLGRYIESDPLGLGGGLNSYVYVRANPLASFDRLGLVEAGGPSCVSDPLACEGPSLSGGYLTTTGTEATGEPCPFSTVNLPTEYYPPNNGFSNAPEYTTLPPGTELGRWGGEGGTFLSNAGTSSQLLSLPYGTSDLPYSTYTVLKPLPVQSGPVAPWFGQPGGGTQYLTFNPISYLLQNGYLQ